jgi:uncharacterized protein YkwD
MHLRSLARVAAPLITATAVTAVWAGPLIAPAEAASPASTSSATTASPEVSPGTYEARVLHLVNGRRAAHGLRPLRLQTCTDTIADGWSSYLAKTSSFFHQDLGRLLDRCGATWAGETLAEGSVPPRRIVSMWMHSPEHRQIMLAKAPRRIGIGASPGADGTWVVTADFTRF